MSTYIRTPAEQEFYNWLMEQPPPEVKPIPNEDDPLERYLNKEKRLEQYIKNQKRNTRRRQRRMEVSELSTKEVSQWLAKRIPGMIVD